MRLGWFDMKFQENETYPKVDDIKNFDSLGQTFEEKYVSDHLLMVRESTKSSTLGYFYTSTDVLMNFLRKRLQD